MYIMVLTVDESSRSEKVCKIFWARPEHSHTVSNQDFTTDFPLAPEFRDAVTRRLASTSAAQPIRPTPPADGPPEFSDQLAPLFP